IGEGKGQVEGGGQVRDRLAAAMKRKSRGFVWARFVITFVVIVGEIRNGLGSGFVLGDGDVDGVGWSVAGHGVGWRVAGGKRRYWRPIDRGLRSFLERGFFLRKRNRDRNTRRRRWGRGRRRSGSGPSSSSGLSRRRGRKKRRRRERRRRVKIKGRIHGTTR